MNPANPKPSSAIAFIGGGNMARSLIGGLLGAGGDAASIRVAEPVAALYEAGRVRHAGLFAKLEDQLCGLLAGGQYTGPGRSPDRADALVWALTELLLEKPKVEPRVRGL